MSRIRSDISDRAISIAKQWGHADVEPRHVLLAIAAEFGVDTQSARDGALSPRGSALDAPTLGDAAADLLNRCTSREEAMECLGDLGPGIGLEMPSGSIGEQRLRDTAAEEISNRNEIGALGAASRDVDAVLRDLDRLVGLDSVKASISELVHVHRLNQERAARDLPTMPAGLNLVFTGHPGTGKTSVARLVAELYRSLGLLPDGHLVEVHRADLVGGYVGQTAIQVERVVKRAMGGVLFIDEAYALASPSPEDYGREAIATLMKLMEDNRDRLSVIVAGYPEPMDAFIRSNAGLRSRFQRFVHFPDYGDDELEQIFIRLAADHQLEVSDAVVNRVRDVIRISPTELRNGNGRFVRNLLEEAYARMAARANADGLIEDHEVSKMEPDDIPDPFKEDLPEMPGMYL